jgi:hypothetical protein
MRLRVAGAASEQDVRVGSKGTGPKQNMGGRNHVRMQIQAETGEAEI